MIDDPELTLTDAAAWRAWLDEHESTSDGVWLVLAKKGKDAPTTLSYAAALEEALCSGWIDAQGRRRDDATSLQRFCPRRARSRWSARNVGIVERLTAEGRMRPRGLEEVGKAKADGRWDAAYEGPKNIQVPEELAEALAASPRATAMFEILSGQNRYAILHRLANLRTAEAHTRNVAKFVAMLERGETPYPQRRTLDAEG
ncbi:YdeI/OmpD-associated family protein [Myceligenerans pegani]|uniref:YdeI/OmpD-associated family protein n=1 Tax=Myceligenerans pegani TaxID=2776917 RepID=A0ABR9N109_9MICO|nr:YdeI/OmpD-associated family protein [Myceligenerans sp. TRM 65318]MBE1876834.1 YdeI/OmpD-associated family protein [Myceligenerans sp. TRM 65318]MBE3019105.1 YdeI/OmpD-associated family protein [Myceligenerans sp. TRM 65318]